MVDMQGCVLYFHNLLDTPPHVHDMGTAWSWAPPHVFSCSVGWGFCVAQKHRLFVVSDAVHSQLHVHSMDDGSLVRTIGAKGSGKGQFAFSFGSLCTTPDGDSVLVCEAYNNRVQEVQIGGL